MQKSPLPLVLLLLYIVASVTDMHISCVCVCVCFVMLVATRLTLKRHPTAHVLSQILLLRGKKINKTRAAVELSHLRTCQTHTHTHTYTNITRLCVWTQYHKNGEIASAVVMRLPQYAAIETRVYGAGKMVCSGAKTEEDAICAMQSCARIIKAIELPNVMFQYCGVRNVLASYTLSFRVPLATLALAYGEFTYYDPRHFSGLIIRIPEPKVVVKILMNGKLIFTGATSIADVVVALRIVHPMLKEHMVQK